MVFDLPRGCLLNHLVVPIEFGKTVRSCYGFLVTSPPKIAGFYRKLTYINTPYQRIDDTTAIYARGRGVGRAPYFALTTFF